MFEFCLPACLYIHNTKNAVLIYGVPSNVDCNFEDIHACIL